MSQVIGFPVINRLGNTFESCQNMFYVKYEDMLLTRQYLLTNGGSPMEVQLINQLIIKNLNDDEMFPIVPNNVNNFYREKVIPLFLDLKTEEHRQWDLL